MILCGQFSCLKSVREREDKEKKEKIEQLTTAEYKRNRQRVAEILIFVDKIEKQIKQM